MFDNESGYSCDNIPVLCKSSLSEYIAFAGTDIRFVCKTKLPRFVWLIL